MKAELFSKKQKNTSLNTTSDYRRRRYDAVYYSARFKYAQEVCEFNVLIISNCPDCKGADCLAEIVFNTRGQAVFKLLNLTTS